MELVVVGGGIAGVCCAEELCRLGAGHQVTLVSASSTLKVQRTMKDQLWGSASNGGRGGDLVLFCCCCCGVWGGRG